MRMFISDNVAPACPEVMEAVIAANCGDAASYGVDEWTVRLRTLLSEIFETDLLVYPVVSGTAANALALSAIAPPFGKIFCHRKSHIYTDECGAPEFFTGGAKLVPLQGVGGRLFAEELASSIHGANVVHHAQPAAVSITQACENGTIYALDEIAALSEVARAHGLKVHMDGARFANALVTLNATPAEMTWKSGIDVLSFGGTKNGCIAAEAVIFFRPYMAATFPYLQKRSGQLLSKQRFVSAQLEGYLRDDVWLRNARSANKMASLLSQGLRNIAGVELPYKTQSNEVFSRLPDSVIRHLMQIGCEINEGELEGTAPPRFVAAWNTKVEDVDRLLANIRLANEVHH